MARFRIVLALIVVAACTKNEKASAPAAPSGGMTITSSAFQNNGVIPSKYTCDGANVNPPLAFSGVPPSAKSLALTVQDPDAPVGTFTHWIAWRIPPSTTSIGEGQHVGTEERNGFGKAGYGGPCPPSGTHHYVFTLYAMSDEAPPDKGHVIAQSQLIGTYSKK
jgi:Raf kinase inhibitor-like YbhB/YbcL family protein